MVLLAEPRVTGNIVAALAGNRSDPAYMASHLAVLRDLVQAVLHVSSKDLLLLG